MFDRVCACLCERAPVCVCVCVRACMHFFKMRIITGKSSPREGRSRGQDAADRPKCNQKKITLAGLEIDIVAFYIAWGPPRMYFRTRWTQLGDLAILDQGDWRFYGGIFEPGAYCWPADSVIFIGWRFIHRYPSHCTLKMCLVAHLSFRERSHMDAVLGIIILKSKQLIKKLFGLQVLILLR